MNNAQTAAKLLEYADRCVAAYDAADPPDRSAAMKTALSECVTNFSSLKPNLQLGSREKARAQTRAHGPVGHSGWHVHNEAGAA